MTIGTLLEKVLCEQNVVIIVNEEILTEGLPAEILCSYVEEFKDCVVDCIYSDMDDLYIVLESN